MELIRITLKIQSAFATPLKGDTLFGQLCWQLRNTLGEQHLEQLLDGYTEGKPFLVVSDPFPAGYVPRPTIPSALLGFDNLRAAERKQQKQKQWLPIEHINLPLNQWGKHLLTTSELLLASGHNTPHKEFPLKGTQNQQHNSLNRLTGSTGKGAGFSPFQQKSTWYHPTMPWEIYATLDTEKLSIENLLNALEGVGASGYGKEASSGLGKFTVQNHTLWQWQTSPQANSWLTLAPCSPQSDFWQPDKSFYSTFTRFGRHGDRAVLTGSPYKAPLLLAETAAILTPTQLSSTNFCGQGITHISKNIPSTVHQGYSPTLPVYQEST